MGSVERATGGPPCIEGTVGRQPTDSRQLITRLLMGRWAANGGGGGNSGFQGEKGLQEAGSNGREHGIRQCFKWRGVQKYGTYVETVWSHECHLLGESRTRKLGYFFSRRERSRGRKRKWTINEGLLAAWPLRLISLFLCPKIWVAETGNYGGFVANKRGKLWTRRDQRWLMMQGERELGESDKAADAVFPACYFPWSLFLPFSI